VVIHQGPLLPFQDEIGIILDDYVLRGGYPEIQLDKLSLDETVRRLRDQIHLVIYRDIVRVFQIRDPTLMEELIALIAIETSQRANYSGLANTLGAKLDTVRSYIGYLEDLFLLSKSSFYSDSRSFSLRKEKKLSIKDPGIRNVVAGTLDEGLLRDSEQVGRVVESMVVDHCKRLAYGLEGKVNADTFYWRSNSQELDIVMKLGGKPVPMEVKYQSSISPSDRKTIKRFVSRYDCPFALMLTKDLEGLVDGIVHMPVWKFLLMC
jgi:predicted AAA+ superfamily ATPase